MVSKTQTIGVCGVEHGVGTTHIALALSNYLCSKLGKKTAYLELYGQNEIPNLTRNSLDLSFQYYGITMYPNALIDDLAHIFPLHYQYIILDMGPLSSEHEKDLYRCDRKLIVGSTRPWKTEKLNCAIENYVNQYDSYQDHITILGNLGVDHEVKKIWHQYEYSVMKVPFLPNPFQLTAADWTFFEDLLNNN